MAGSPPVEQDFDETGLRLGQLTWWKIVMMMVMTIDDDDDDDDVDYHGTSP